MRITPFCFESRFSTGIQIIIQWPGWYSQIMNFLTQLELWLPQPTDHKNRMLFGGPVIPVAAFITLLYLHTTSVYYTAMRFENLEASRRDSVLFAEEPTKSVMPEKSINFELNLNRPETKACDTFSHSILSSQPEPHKLGF
jgi:hypothetical protein